MPLPAQLPISRASRWRWTFLVVRARLGSVAGAVVGVVSVTPRGLPEEPGEYAGAGDRDDAGGLAPLLVEVPPALVEAPLGAPGVRTLQAITKRSAEDSASPTD
jgi:hypothetical protein